MKRLLNALILLLGLLALPAAARDLVLDRAVLEDPSGALTIHEIQQRGFEPTGPMLSRGYTASVHWLRIRVARPDAGGEVVIRIRPSFLDEIRLFELDPSVRGGWRERVTGDQFAFGQREYAAAVHGFIVTPREAETTYFLRVRTSSSMLVSVDARSPIEARHEDHHLSIAHAVFIGVMLAVLMWAVYGYVEHRDRALGLFAIYEASYILYGLAGTGFLAPLSTASAPRLGDWVTNVAVLVLMPAFVPFTVALFREYAPSPALLRGVYLFAAPLPALLVAMAFGATRLVMMLNAVLMMAAQWYFVAVAMSFRREHSPRRGFIQGTYVVIATMVSVFQLSYLGVIVAQESNLRNVIALIVAGSVTGCLFIVLFHRRSAQLRRERHDAELSLAMSNKALEYERLLKQQAEVLANVDHLTGLPNRRHFVEVAGRELHRAQRLSQPMALLMIDIDHFKRVNDTRGHSVGDVVLRAVGRCAQDTLRTVDFVARVGGEEFAAMLTEVGGVTAYEIAERVRRAVQALAIVPDEGEPVGVTVSIGVTELRARKLNLDSLLKEADEALYRAKNGGRNRIEVAGAP